MDDRLLRCTRTSISSGVSANRYEAFDDLKALVTIIEAESIVILLPHAFQFRMLQGPEASVAFSMSAAAQVRNGPPDAVMITRTNSSRFAGAERLKQTRYARNPPAGCQAPGLRRAA